MLRTIKIDGFHIKCRLEGRGTEKIYVIGSSDYYSRAFSQELRELFQFAFVDHRGFAHKDDRSRREVVDISQILSDMDFVREQIGWSDMIVLGHSGHGFLALEYAKKHLGHVKGVVLLNLGPSYSPAEMSKLESRWDELADPERKKIFSDQIGALDSFIEANPDERFLRFMLAMAARSWKDPSFDASGLWADIPMNLDVIDALWGKEFRDIDITEGLADLNIPVFLAVGGWDYLVPGVESWNPLRQHFPDLTLRYFPESGHSPMVEQPEIFMSELLSWVEKKL